MQSFLQDKIEELTFSRVELQDSLWREKILDSITIVELVVEIEKQYQIKIPFNEIVEEHFETMDMIIQYIQKKQQA